MTIQVKQCQPTLLERGNLRVMPYRRPICDFVGISWSYPKPIQYAARKIIEAWGVVGHGPS